jgi:hemolysin activation/secretion protein
MRLTSRFFGTLAVFWTIFGQAGAQPASPANALERRGHSAPSQPPLEPTPQPTTGSPAPLLRPPPRAGADLPNDVRVVLRGVQLVGGSIFGQAEINRAAIGFLDRPIGFQDLEELRRLVTLLYVDRGYINSGVIVPDQTLTDGILVLQAVEGRLTEIELTGNRYYRSSYLADRIRRGVGLPFNVNDLGRQQQIMLQDPFLSRLNLGIQPGLVPGEARLSGEVTETKPYLLTTQIANSQSPTVGEVRGQMQGVVSNVLGIGDILSLQYGRSEGINDGSVSYSLPLSSDDTRLSFRYDVNSSLVVAQNFRPLEITSEYHSIGIGLSRPFYRTPEQALTLGLSLERRTSRTFLLGEPFSFSPGTEDGRTNVTALRFYQDWLDRNSERVIALRSTFSVGIDVLDATVTRTPPTGKFFAWLGQAQYVRRVFETWEFLARANLQLSSDPLFPIEQFVLGGFSTVRGYREYLSATDNALTGTAELRIPVGRLSLPIIDTTLETGTIQLVPFYDHGVGWNTRRATPPNSRLSSIGIGLRWLAGPGTAVEVYYGYALRQANSGNSLQDQGLHFRIVTSLF